MKQLTPEQKIELKKARQGRKYFRISWVLAILCLAALGLVISEIVLLCIK